eukprot:c27372_g1_i1 orf=61-348(+)
MLDNLEEVLCNDELVDVKCWWTLSRAKKRLLPFNRSNYLILFSRSSFDCDVPINVVDRFVGSGNSTNTSQKIVMGHAKDKSAMKEASSILNDWGP